MAIGSAGSAELDCDTSQPNNQNQILYELFLQSDEETFAPRHHVPRVSKEELRPVHTHGAARLTSKSQPGSKRGGGTGGACERSAIAEFIRGYS
jgi:hypothetical protein